MSVHAEMIANRYQLRLSAAWKRWFSGAPDWLQAENMEFPGAFQTRLSAAELSGACPQAIWPGFMLPDTLPILGNQYGDWICVRIGPDGSCGELIHWYHGGGDWIPVGTTMEEAILHDVVDQFRPLRTQMLRGAAETLLPDNLQQVSRRLAQPGLQSWLIEGLPMSGASPGEALQEVLVQLAEGDYTAALSVLFAQEWAFEATACDMVEQALQGQAGCKLSNHRELANHASLDSRQRSELVKWLFDIDAHANPLEQFADQCHDLVQDWDLAATTCAQVVERRQDLGWAFDILGWNYQRNGDLPAAAEIYFSGRHASSFSDQAVRLGSHWFDQRFGKFSVAQLWSLQDSLPPNMLSDDYLRAIHTAAPQEMLLSVQNYWLARGEQALEGGEFEVAYQAFYAAGWDLGAQRLTHYQPILRQLIQAAQSAGWTARAAVAQAHLQCLEARLK